MRIVYSRQASDDLVSIWEYLRERNPQAALQLVAEFDQAGEFLRDFPFSGQKQPGVRAELRHKVVESYLLLYRVWQDEVEIIRIVHGSRYLPDLL